MTNATVNNASPLDLSVEGKLIVRIGKNASAAIGEANTAGMRYVDFGLATGNLDLLRMLRDALTHKSLQAKLDSWVKRVAPIKRKSHKKPSGDVTYSYIKDKKRSRKEGWQVLDQVAYSTGPMAYKAPKKDAPAMTLEAILKLVSGSLERVAGKIEDDADDVALGFRLAIEELVSEAEEKLEALTRKATPAATNEEVVTLIKAAANG